MKPYALWQGATPPIPALLQVLDGTSATVFGLTGHEQDLALNNAVVPFHEGASRYYRAAGIGVRE